MKKTLRRNHRGRVILRQMNRIVDPEVGRLIEDSKLSWADWFYEDVMTRRARRRKLEADARWFREAGKPL